MTRPALSSPELHRNCIVHEIGKLGCMLMTNTSQNQRQTANDEGQKKTVKKAKTVKTAKTATAAKDQRTANGQGRFDKSVTVCLCRSLSVFMNIVAIFQVNIQQHIRNFAQKADQRKCLGLSQWRDKKEIDSVSCCPSLSVPTGLNLHTERHRTNIFHS